MDFFRRQTIVYPSVQRNKPKAEVTTSSFIFYLSFLVNLDFTGFAGFGISFMYQFMYQFFETAIFLPSKILVNVPIMYQFLRAKKIIPLSKHPQSGRFLFVFVLLLYVHKGSW